MGIGCQHHVFVYVHNSLGVVPKELWTLYFETGPLTGQSLPNRLGYRATKALEPSCLSPQYWQHKYAQLFGIGYGDQIHVLVIV